MKDKITLVYTYYEAPDMLREQIKYWVKYPKEIAERVKIVIVDDGSPEKSAEGVIGFFSSQIPDYLDIKLYRIKEDINQNTFGARNLAFTLAKEGWMWNLDIDHVVPTESLVGLLNNKLKPNIYYLPNRRIMTTMDYSEPIWRHSDSFIITREMFWEIGGYDEAYTGYYYNGPSYMFRQASIKKFPQYELDNVWTLLFGPNLILDASPLLHEKKTRLQKYINEYHYQPKDPLRFEWEEVKIKEMA